MVMSCRLAQTISASNSIETKVFPNPAHGQFNVSFNASSAEDFTLKVIDQTGRIMNSVVVNAVEGNNVQEINVEDLAAGLYLVVLESNKLSLIHISEPTRPY